MARGKKCICQVLIVVKSFFLPELPLLWPPHDIKQLEKPNPTQVGLVMIMPTKVHMLSIDNKMSTHQQKD
jgi:hypothetical protein